MSRSTRIRAELLDLEIKRLGLLMELAHLCGDRAAADVHMAGMYAAIRTRNAELAGPAHVEVDGQDFDISRPQELAA